MPLDYSGGLIPVKGQGKEESALDCQAALRGSAIPKGAAKERLTVKQSHSWNKWPGSSTHALFSHQFGAHVFGFYNEIDPKGTAA